MRVVVVHNHYRQPGGEDEVFRAEVGLLRAHGHEVDEYTTHNDSIRDGGSLTSAARTIWNPTARSELLSLLRARRPRVAHFHNTFPIVSPSAYYAARAEGVAVVQTLHNFRLACPGATLTRNGRVCELCLSRAFKWPALAHACYRQSRAATAAVVAMQGVHALMGTWRQAVDAYVALTEFARAKMVEAGLPRRRIEVKPNFCEDPGEVGDGGGGYALYVGRLAPEKGVAVLLDAWRRLDGCVRLKIAGDGPLASDVWRAATVDPSVEPLGAVARADLTDLMRNAAFLVVPSLWYEMFPRVIAEALAVGTPILVSRVGSLREIVEDGVAGLHFAPGDADDLARGVLALASSPEWLARLRGGARRAYEARLSPGANHRRLIEIYEGAIRARARRTAALRLDARDGEIRT